MRGLYYALVPWVLGGAALFECNSTDPCADAGACVDASSVPPVSGGGCDSSKPASQGGCAVDDTDGFFVSPTGSDTNAGTKVAPFKTIKAGIAAAATAASKPNIYVCAGTYPENLVIQNAAAGVALHGGFDCASWAQTNAATTVSPTWTPNATAPQYVLHVLGDAALVEGLTLTAPDATDPSASSLAVLIDGSPGMTFRRATVTSGAASNGADGTQAAQLPANSPGNSTTDGTAPPAKVCTCSKDQTVGGSGGGFVDGGFSPPSSGAPVIGGNTDAGHSGTASSPAGVAGADGVIGKVGNSTGTLGELTTNGWIASPGAPGVLGATAQGGGGAYGDPGANISGGSGGCGGCGGQGGTGGAGGGASIAIGAINTVALRIQSSTIRAGKAGSGGNGALGQPGQLGGAGGSNQALAGGTGGRGGDGGPGGGGAGGVSVAIATANTTPDIDTQSTVLAGAAGAGGHDGSAGGTKAIDGISAPVHAF
jgi:hypothetical protein